MSNLAIASRDNISFRSSRLSCNFIQSVLFYPSLLRKRQWRYKNRCVTSWCLRLCVHAFVNEWKHFDPFCYIFTAWRRTHESFSSLARRSVIHRGRHLINKVSCYFRTGVVNEKVRIMHRYRMKHIRSFFFALSNHWTVSSSFIHESEMEKVLSLQVHSRDHFFWFNGLSN